MEKKLKNSSSTDIAIIGGGPSSAFAAIEALKKKREVEIFEEHSKIGVPIQCAGLISLSGFKRLKIRVPKDCIQNKVRGSIIYSPNNNKIIIKRKSTQALVIDRGNLDNYLIRSAENLDGKIHTKARVLELLKGKNNSILGIKINKDGKIIEKHSKIVIDGEGVQARFIRQAGLRKVKRSYILPAVQYEMSKVDIIHDFVEMFFGRKISPGFFSYIIPTSEETARVAVATNYGRPIDYLKYFIKKHPIASKKLQKGKIDKISAGSILIGGPIKKTYSNQFLGIGDAVGHVKPTTGGGVVLGGLCAKIAGEIAAESIDKNDTSENFLMKYDKIWRKRFGKEFQYQKLLRLLINNVPDKILDKGFEVISKNNIVELVEEIGDMDLQSSLLKKVLFSPRIFKLLISFIYALIFP
ncbi:MAG: NAD(P)/FAD-dependent oxidoreductase [Candidatus Helarchaeota archaeon]|nr:NAD(P)/FAD-dependent oxidoreductase [Candidatus Helarchaeota archaeon]